eukprot:CAMPEP_0197051846 /NCGR_PEP_ID=MMETSP1384-20130603/26406_1 /TAXON_ID=29189 /ORGANISM="Ammonia sp." /LENGTH=547 /DNA_ID=CAMNT_0042484457 /DNA_START=24 /DNA_END=1667 /DNA_ORIENTATION=-
MMGACVVVLLFTIRACNAVEYEMILNHIDYRNGLFSSNVRSTGLENENDPSANTYSIIGTFDEAKRSQYRDASGYYQFKLMFYHRNNITDTLIWKQTSWITEPTITGFSAISATGNDNTVFDLTEYGSFYDFQGLGLNVGSHQQYTYLDGSGDASSSYYQTAGLISLFGSTGTIGQTGIPGMYQRQVWGQEHALSETLYIAAVTNVSTDPSNAPSNMPTNQPSSKQPSVSPTRLPTELPSQSPTVQPSSSPSKQPSASPVRSPTEPPSQLPTVQPSSSPSKQPSVSPTRSPTELPSQSPSVTQPGSPTMAPTASNAPSNKPTVQPSGSPSKHPTLSPLTELPTVTPSGFPTLTPIGTDSPSIDNDDNQGDGQVDEEVIGDEENTNNDQGMEGEDRLIALDTLYMIVAIGCGFCVGIMFIFFILCIKRRQKSKVETLEMAAQREQINGAAGNVPVEHLQYEHFSEISHPELEREGSNGDGEGNRGDEDLQVTAEGSYRIGGVGAYVDDNQQEIHRDSMYVKKKEDNETTTGTGGTTTGRTTSNSTANV